MTALREIIEAKQQEQEEEPSTRRGTYVGKSGMSDGIPLSSSTAFASPHESAGPSSNSGRRNGFLPPRCSLVGQQSSTVEDISASAGPSEGAVHTVDCSLSLSIPSNKEQIPMQSSRIGSPLTSTLLTVQSSLELAQRPTLIQSLQGNSAPGGGGQFGVAARPAGQPHLPGRPPTAQLTIFYAGMVNVYDNVPADKAQAIMLLAGSGSSWSSSIMTSPVSVPARPPSSTGGSRLISATAGAGSTRPSNLPAPPDLPKAALSQGVPLIPLAPAVSIAGGLIGRSVIPVHVELPQARKASLFRFLEKRKDRVRGAAVYGNPTFGSRKQTLDRPCTPPKEKSPSPNLGKMFARSPPAGNIGTRKRSPSPASRTGPSQSSGTAGESSSPSRRLVMSQKACEAGFSGPSKDDHMEWASKQSHFAAQEQKPEPMVEELVSLSHEHYD